MGIINNKKKIVRYFDENEKLNSFSEYIKNEAIIKILKMILKLLFIQRRTKFKLKVM